MPNVDKCPQCGTPLSPGALAGLCPACLLKAGATADTVTDPKQPPFHPPTVAELAAIFPQWEILELIGKGGMGAVYKARQKQLDRIVALKILPPDISSDPAFAERFTREARALAKLNHPNIVTLYEFGETGGQFYFLMEFVDGVNLRQLLNNSRLSPREALAIVPQICDALQFAHDHGIVHRDIKPENILLDRRGRVKVADFGLAKIIGAETADTPAPGQPAVAGSTVLTDAGKVMGTPPYMSPEQKENPGDVDHRADIYALGVVFYQMLTGELPGKKIEPPSRKVQLDVRLDEIVLRALEKKPEMRFQQASVLKTEVETLTAEPQKPNPAAQSRFSRTAILAVACLAVIAAMLALLLLARHHDQNRASTNFFIGQTYFPQGDSIEITSVERNGDQMTVRGHYNLVSTDTALLALFITSTNRSRFPEDAKQRRNIAKGQGDFELSIDHRVPGLPHVSMYANGHPFATLYFGTEEEADGERLLNLSPPASAVADTENKIQRQIGTTNQPLNVSPSLTIFNDQPPVVVETSPRSGARDVPPGETEIRVRFSKPMTDGSWSWSTAWKNSTPDFIGSPHYESNGKTCVARVKLEPGRTYGFWLNSDSFQNFQDTGGRPAVPYLLIFQTKNQ
jgi:serine/threonine protein kinase